MPLVDYEELEGSPTYNLTTKNITAKRLLKCLWDDVDDLVAEFSPYPGNIFATFPGRPLLWVDTIEIEPYPGCPPDISESHPNTYDHAKVTVNYKTIEFDDGSAGSAADNSPSQGGNPQANSQTLLSRKVSIGGEFMILPSAGLCWEKLWDPVARAYGVGTNNVLGEVSAGLIIPQIEHQITWHKVLYPPWSAIRTSIGRVNSATFSGCPAGTLLFLGAEASIDLSSEGTKSWNLEYKFTYKNVRYVINDEENIDKGWNYFYRPETGHFEKLKRRGAPMAPSMWKVAGRQAEVNVQRAVTPTGDIYEATTFSPLFVLAIL